MATVNRRSEKRAEEPNAMIYLAYAGAVSLAVGLLTLGVGLVRRRGE